jgi:hypothetical protein
MKMQNTEVYWSECREATLQLRAAALKAERQPRSGDWFYMTSQKVRGGDPSARAGAVCEMAAKLAGQTVVDGSHRLATDEEIAGHLADQERRRAAVLSASAKGRGQVVFAQPKSVVSAGTTDGGTK